MPENNDLGLLVNIYRSKYDSTNGGVSRKDAGDELVVFGTDVVPLEGYIKRGEYAYPEVQLERTPYGDVKAVARPTPLQGEHVIGPMFGGNYIATSDSRFQTATGIYGAVPLHDRYETPQQYKSLSD